MERLSGSSQPYFHVGCCGHLAIWGIIHALQPREDLLRKYETFTPCYHVYSDAAVQNIFRTACERSANSAGTRERPRRKQTRPNPFLHGQTLSIDCARLGDDRHALQELAAILARQV